MKNCSLLSLLSLLLAAALSLTAASAAPQQTEVREIPERVVVVSGDSSKLHKDIVAIIFSPADIHFHDPSAPRFLFLDRKGKIAFGIGGNIYATAAYNFAGSSSTGSDFIPSTLPVPANPDQRAALQFTARHSTIFFQLAGHAGRLGTFSAYIQTDFTGGSGSSRHLTLVQAYVKIGDVTAGLARSTFVDAASIPTVDTRGPAGINDAKNVLVQYSPQFSSGWSGAISLEASPAGISNGLHTRTISQRVPDLPVYVKFAWGNSGNHVRLSAILRNLCYRDALTGRRRYTTGYGVSFSSYTALGAGFGLYSIATFGQGIGSYVADTKNLNYDLIPSARNAGRLFAPRIFAHAAGLRYDFSPRVFATAAWGQVTLYDRGALDGSTTYRTGKYFSVNAFYNLFENCLLGLEYARGSRRNFDGSVGTGNRIMTAVRYSF